VAANIVFLVTGIDGMTDRKKKKLKKPYFQLIFKTK
jgi:hypothetical protein